MPNTREVRLRISSVKNISQVTRALQAVSASKVRKAQQAVTSYYIIGYYPTNTNLDGKFRRVKITLRDIPSAKLDYRQGYFGGKVFSKFTAADKERQLEEALMLGDPITDLTIAMEVNYFQLNRAEYFVPITVKIPGSELVLAKGSGAERTLIDRSRFAPLMLIGALPSCPLLVALGAG